MRTDTGSLAIVADAALAEVEACDVLVVPVAPGRARRLADERIVDWIRVRHDTTSWTTSVCTGSELLGAAGLLAGLDATTHWSAVERLESYGATYRPRRYVVQGRIITAAGVSAGIDMALALAALHQRRGRGPGHPARRRVRPRPPVRRRGSVASAGPAIVELVRGVLSARERLRPPRRRCRSAATGSSRYWEQPRAVTATTSTSTSPRTK